MFQVVVPMQDEALRRNIEFLQGKNILDLNPTRLRLPYGAASSGFEMALYDAAGKAVGWPVHRLLGGLAQPKVLVKYWCGRKNPTDMRRVVQRVEAGISAQDRTPIHVRLSHGDSRSVPAAPRAWLGLAVP